MPDALMCAFEATDDKMQCSGVMRLLFAVSRSRQRLKQRRKKDVQTPSKAIKNVLFRSSQRLKSRAK